MPTNVRDVSTAEFASAVIERSRRVPVVVDFWAGWCGPCKVLGPTLERLAEEGGGRWELAKVDVDRNQQLAVQFGVQGIPTVVGFRDGRPVARFTGALPEQQVRRFLDQVLPSELDLAAEQGHAALDAGDEAGAEAAFRSVLSQDPAHQSAGLGLAGILLDRDRPDEALEVLGRLAPTEPVRQLTASARLSVDADLDELAASAATGDPAAELAYGKGLAAAGRLEEAFDRLLDLVAARYDGVSDEARLVVLDLFEVLGPDHPLTSPTRKRLASALF